ncbi:MAG: YciK family oxidoreductase [Gammaproteobacteria bacterium]|nr:MAG: YciK family oxidoreductase [Gammaproteobacteria bacterium]
MINLALTHEQIRNYQPKNNCLADKTILVTGAGDGIGRIAALTYAKYGATVLLLGKTLSKLTAVYDEIEQQGGAQPVVIALNLEGAKAEDMTNLVELIIKETGQLDGILHNAAILGDLAPLESYDIGVFEQVMNVNFMATLRLTQALLPVLKKSANGSVVFTSSSVGSEPRAFWGAYAISKQAVEGISSLFTQETKNTTNLRFNCVNPGATRTRMRAEAKPNEDPMTLKTPEDIMPAYVCLMTDDSLDVKGEVINLNLQP